ncbi:MAG: hypothetical protein HY847_19550 [Betaproteobacteria bacterium]|nr:hypothetical protein [Betaproteobacteria bacterium]
MTTHPLFEKLCRHLGAYRSDDLPVEICYLDRYRNLVVKPLLDASLDEIAFAVQTLHEESMAISSRRSALEYLYTFSRKRGAVGADQIIHIAEEVTK